MEFDYEATQRCPNRTNKEFEVRVNDEMVVNYCFDHHCIWINQSTQFFIDCEGDNVLPVLGKVEYSEIFKGCGNQSSYLREMRVGTVLGMMFAEALRCFQKLHTFSVRTLEGYSLAGYNYADQYTQEYGAFGSHITNTLRKFQNEYWTSRALRIMSKSKDYGYVYFIMSLTNPPQIKIGRSKSPDVRIRKLGVVLPFDVEPIHIIETDNAARLEATYHELFDYCRSRGEWFDIPESQLETIKQHTRSSYALDIDEYEGFWRERL